mgnify:CR=1 FL=1
MIWSNTRGILDAGLVYNHQSNGHTKLPNQGLNSFLISLRQTWNNLSDGNYSKSDRYINSRPVDKISRGNQSELLDSDVVGDEEIVTQLSQYLEARFGYGLNVLALAFNDLRPVRTFSITWGQTHNGHFRWGIGAFYRFYQHYHDYIKGNESLVRPGQEFDEFRVNPLRYSSNFGVHFNGEVLIGHFGLSTQLGLNFYKPGYGIDWRINEGWDYAPRELPPNWVLGKYNTKYQLKKHLSTRLGLRYYLWSNQENTLRLGAISSDSIYINPFLGAHINANLGQADFSEVSFGVIFHLGQSHN